MWIAIEYSYKLGQKMNLNFCAYMADFCRVSHICSSFYVQGLEFCEICKQELRTSTNVSYTYSSPNILIQFRLKVLQMLHNFCS